MQVLSELKCSNGGRECRSRTPFRLRCLNGDRECRKCSNEEQTMQENSTECSYLGCKKHNIKHSYLTDSLGAKYSAPQKSSSVEKK